MAAAEDLEFELEALLATYGEDAVHVHQQPSSSHTCDGGSPATATIGVPVAPRSDAESEQFVAALLVLTLSPAYPSQPPSVQLKDAKGLPDQHLAKLQAALQAEALSMAGEMQLGHLVETALELLTAANQPSGACAICLELLTITGAPPTSSSSSSSSSRRGDGVGDPCSAALPVVCLPCYHCYHTACFGPWWHWQQRRLAQRERQLWSEYKSMAVLKLEEEGIRQEGVSGCGNPAGNAQADGGAAERAYVLPCPACRAEVAPASLARVWQQLQAVTAETWSGGSGGGRAGLAELPQQQRQQLQAMQRRHAVVMRRQQQCGGLVEASHSVSLSDLQQAGTAAATAAAAATEAAAEARAVAGPSPAAPGPGSSSSAAGLASTDQPSGGRHGGRGGRQLPASGRGGRPRGGWAGGGKACGGGGSGGGGRGDKDGQQRRPPAPAAPGAAAAAAAAAASLNGLHVHRPAGQQQARPSAGRGRSRGHGAGNPPAPAGPAPASST